MTKLMEGTEVPDMCRAQGSVGIIDLILNLPEDLRSYEKDVREKRVKPLQEFSNA